METIAQIQDTDILTVIAPTVAAMLPLLENRRAEIEAVSRSTFKYGPTERHQLDIYYPVAHNGADKTPVLIWVYGGGFVSGSRRLEPPDDLSYACVGAYFARKGFVTIIPDYRLVPTTFPGGAEDVRDATLWAIRHPEHLTTPTSPNPDVQHLFMMGHSAGATHVISALLLPETPDTVLRPYVSGAVLHAAVYDFNVLTLEGPLYSGIVSYWNGKERMMEDEPLPLFKKATDAVVASLPRILVVEAEKEPDWLLASGARFRDAVEARLGKQPERIVAKGHNHISTSYALSTGQGEQWAVEVVSWIEKSFA